MYIEELKRFTIGNTQLIHAATTSIEIIGVNLFILIVVHIIIVVVVVGAVPLRMSIALNLLHYNTVTGGYSRSFG